MSEMLNQLIKVINETKSEDEVRLKYVRMKKRSEELTNLIILKNEVPDGQGCAYLGGYPV